MNNPSIGEVVRDNALKFEVSLNSVPDNIGPLIEGSQLEKVREQRGAGFSKDVDEVYEPEVVRGRVERLKQEGLDSDADLSMVYEPKFGESEIPAQLSITYRGKGSWNLGKTRNGVEVEVKAVNSYLQGIESGSAGGSADFTLSGEVRGELSKGGSQFEKAGHTVETIMGYIEQMREELREGYTHSR